MIYSDMFLPLTSNRMSLVITFFLSGTGSPTFGGQTNPLPSSAHWHVFSLMYDIPSGSKTTTCNQFIIKQLLKFMGVIREISLKWGFSFLVKTSKMTGCKVRESHKLAAIKVSFYMYLHGGRALVIEQNINLIRPWRNIKPPTLHYNGTNRSVTTAFWNPTATI